MDKINTKYLIKCLEDKIKLKNNHKCFKCDNNTFQIGGPLYMLPEFERPNQTILNAIHYLPLTWFFCQKCGYTEFYNSMILCDIDFNEEEKREKEAENLIKDIKSVEEKSQESERKSWLAKILNF